MGFGKPHLCCRFINRMPLPSEPAGLLAVGENVPMSLVKNERAKLFANALNNVAVATFVTALIAPFANFLYGMASPPSSRFWPLAGFCWFSAGLVLHWLAQLTLKRLTP